MKAIYVRQSLDKKDSLSIAAQIDDCINLCKRNGWNDYKVYKDKGWSAKNLERPAFQKLNRDVQSGLIDGVVCYKIDRISRSIRDFVNLIVDYQELGVHFISFADNINTAAPGGMMMATLFVSLAQMEREAIITRVTDNYYYRCELGFWGGGPAPYGFHLKKIVDNGQKHTVLEPDPEEADTVRRLYDWYLEPGATIRSIMNRAHLAGMRTRGGGHWTSRVLSELLSRPLYAPNTMDIFNYFASQGVRVRVSPDQCDGKQSFNLFGLRDRNSAHPKRSRPVNEMTFAISKHESIIDSDTFLKVQFKKKAKLAVTPRAGTSHHTVLSGLVKCGYCGRAMSPSGSKGGRYFTCSGRRNYALGVCKGKSVKIDTLDQIVLHDLADYISRPEIKAKFKNGKTQSLEASKQAKINTYQQDIAAIDISIQKLVDACTTSGDVAVKYLNERIEQMDAEKQKLQAEILQIKNKSSRKLELDGMNIDNAPASLESGSFEEKKYLCNFFIEKIIFTAKDDVQIKYTV